MDKTGIGDRMKGNYENRYRFSIPRRTNTIIRVDGKCFHQLTRKADKPFDDYFMECMARAAVELCKQVQGCKFGYVQSDEISLWLTDYDDIKTDAWFDGNLQKMCSISAATATATFSELWGQKALFDSRVFIIPDIEEVINYFIWRQQDATRNSINMVAQSLYPHKQLQGKNTDEAQEMIFQKGQNWNDYPIPKKRGYAIIKDTEWKAVEPPIFTQERYFITNRYKNERT